MSPRRPRLVPRALRRTAPALEPGDAVVLLYHRVSEPDSDLWRLSVRPETFAEHLELIASTCATTPLGDLVEALDGQRPLPTGSVAVTFDDGYRDNLEVAQPLLERFGMPATIFVATAYVDSDRDFWWDELERFLRAEQRRRPRDHRALRSSLQRLGDAARRAELDRMWESIGLSPPAATGAPTSADVRAMAAGELLEVGAHTSTHPRLTQLPAHEQLEEMAAGKAFLEALIGRPVEHFSYPHGDHDDQTVACARDAGFASACTTVPQAVSAATDPFRIPRLSIENWPAAELGRRLDALLAR